MKRREGSRGKMDAEVAGRRLVDGTADNRCAEQVEEIARKAPFFLRGNSLQDRMHSLDRCVA